MNRMAAKFVPKLLNFEQAMSLSMAQELLNDVNNDSGLLKPPDLNPCDFFLFPKLKKPMKRDQDRIEERADGHTEKRILEVLPGLEISLAQVYSIQGQSNQPNKGTK